MRAVAFDAYGTLFDVFSVTALCERLFPGHGAALAQLWRAKQLQYSLLTSLMGRYKDFWQLTGDGLVYAAKTLNLPLTDAKRGELLEAYLRLDAFADVKPGLAALRQRGLRLAILSNGEPEMLRAAVASAAIGDLLDDIISVDEVKVFKPDPRTYALAARRLGVAPDAVAFVSANSWDVSGAGAAGLFTIWVQRAPGESQEKLGFPAARIVQSLVDIEAVLA
jgi:2-haloacid dehalogenase